MKNQNQFQNDSQSKQMKEIFHKEVKNKKKSRNFKLPDKNLDASTSQQNESNTAHKENQSQNVDYMIKKSSERQKMRLSTEQPDPFYGFQKKKLSLKMISEFKKASRKRSASRSIHPEISQQKIMNFTKICSICEQEILEQNLSQATICEHKNNFCQFCMNTYVFFKIEQYQEVFCPSENCESTLNQNSQFFLSLPLKIQAKYKKIHNFYQSLTNPEIIKCCSKEDCQGFVKFIEEKLFCTECKAEYCIQCYFEKHQDTCDNHEVDFFQNNLHFRQCKKCKMIVERSQGCDHMICRCRHEFCYMCGQTWRHEHKCGIKVQSVCERLQEQQQRFRNQEIQWSSCILKFPLKLGLLLLWIFLNSIIFLIILLSIFGMMVLSLAIGCFVFSFEFLSKFECPLALVFILLFPVCMLVGTAKACKQFLWAFTLGAMTYYCEFFGHGVLNIYDI